MIKEGRWKVEGGMIKEGRWKVEGYRMIKF